MNKGERVYVKSGIDVEYIIMTLHYLNNITIHFVSHFTTFSLNGRHKNCNRIRYEDSCDPSLTSLCKTIISDQFDYYNLEPLYNTRTMNHDLYIYHCKRQKMHF